MISTGPANAAVAVIGIDNSFHVVFGVTDKIRATWLFLHGTSTPVEQLPSQSARSCAEPG
jgi:hypothetical protein